MIVVNKSSHTSTIRFAEIQSYLEYQALQGKQDDRASVDGHQSTGQRIDMLGWLSPVSNAENRVRKPRNSSSPAGR